MKKLLILFMMLAVPLMSAEPVKAVDITSGSGFACPNANCTGLPANSEVWFARGRNMDSNNVPAPHITELMVGTEPGGVLNVAQETNMIWNPSGIATPFTVEFLSAGNIARLSAVGQMAGFVSAPAFTDLYIQLSAKTDSNNLGTSITLSSLKLIAGKECIRLPDVTATRVSATDRQWIRISGFNELLSTTGFILTGYATPTYTGTVDGEALKFDVITANDPNFVADDIDGGQEPYVAAIDDDCFFDDFFISPKEAQWLHPETDYVCERFDASKPLNRPNLCVTQRYAIIQPTGLTINQNSNRIDLIDGLHGYTARIGKGNSGKYKWDIVLPKKPSGDLNITVQCGILKPNETDIDECAGETGEVVGPSCTRGAGTLNYWALPTIEATAYPGPFAETTFTTPFHLTAFRNPSTYGNWGYAKDTKNHQVLDGSKSSRIALKACFTKTLFVAMPANGRKNAKGETEHNLNAGDLISVLMTVPSANTVDIYCYPESVKVEGIGEPQSFLPDGSYNADICKWTGGPDGILCDYGTNPPTPPSNGGTAVMCLDDQYVCPGCPDTGNPLLP